MLSQAKICKMRLDNLEERLSLIGMWRVVFVLMLISGVCLSFVTPPFQVPDEPAHFARAYQISDGYLRSPFSWNGTKLRRIANVPFSYEDEKWFANIFQRQHFYSVEDINSLFEVKVDKNNSALFSTNVTNTGQYSPLLYLPQALGIGTACMFDGSAGGIFYAGRLMSVLFAATCVALAIKLLPQKKFLLCVLAFMPMCMAEVASTSADAVTYALCFLITAYMYRLSSDSAPLTKKDIMLLFMVAVSLGLLKQVYGVILFLFLLLPFKKCRSKKAYFFLFSSLICAFLAVSFAWIVFSAHGETNIAPYLGQGAVPAEQMQLVKENFTGFIKTMLHTLCDDWYFHSFVGILGWLALLLPEKFYYGYGIALLAGAFFGNIKLGFMSRLLIISTCILSLMVIFLNQYVTWTPVGADFVDGVQGRYFIPIAFMFFTAFSLSKKLPYENILSIIVGIVSAGITLWYTYSYFY